MKFSPIMVTANEAHYLSHDESSDVHDIEWKLKVTVKSTKPVEDMTGEEISDRFRDEIETRVSETLNGICRDSFATPDELILKPAFSGEFGTESVRHVEWENDGTPFWTVHRIQGLINVKTQKIITDHEAWLLGKSTLAHGVGNALTNKIMENVDYSGRR